MPQPSLVDLPAPTPRRTLLALAGLLLLLSLAYVRWPLSAHTQQPATWINMDHFQDDLPDYRLAWGRWRRGEVPLWNPYQLCGIPIVPTLQTGVFYPGNVAFLVLPPARALMVTAALHIALTGWLAAWYVARRGVSITGMGAAAILGAFGADVLQRFWVSAFMHASPWIFACLIALDALLERPSRRAAVALAAAFGVQFLAGWPQCSVLTAYLLTARVVWVLATRREGWTQAGRVVAMLALAAGLWVLLTGVQLLPTARLLPQASRNPAGLTAAAVEGEGLAYAPTRMLADATAARPSLRLKRPYIGAVGLLLLLAAWWRPLRPRDTVFYTLVLVGGVWMALGMSGGLYRVYYEFIPTGRWFRDPPRFLYLAHTAAVVLVAFGAENVHRRLANRVEPGTRRTLLAGGAAVLACLALALYATRDTAAVLGVPRAGAWLAAVRPWWPLLGCVAALVTLARWRPRPGIVRLVLVCGAALWIADLFYANRNGHAVVTERGHYWADPTVLGIPAEASVAGPRVLLVSDWLDFALNAKWGELAGLAAVDDYDNLHPARFSRFFYFAQHGTPAPATLLTAGRAGIGLDAAHPELLSLLGVRWIAYRGSPLRQLWVDRWPGALPPGVVDRTTPAARERGILLAENTRALPRAYVVHTLETVPTETDALRRLTEPDALAGRVAVRIGATSGTRTSGDASANDRATIERYAPEHVRVRVENATPGWLVLADSWYPGWRATVNGRPADIARVNVLVRAVPVPAGASTADFTFRPRAQLAGGALSVLGMAACGLLVLPRRRRMAA